MTANRLQHIIPGIAIFILGVIVTWLSFTQEPADSFLFPRVVSIAFILLATWNLARALLGLAKVGRGISIVEAKNILPGLIVMLVYVFWLAKALGFYASSTLVFLAIYTLYDAVPISSAKDWVKRIAVTAGFMGVMYLLFAMLLEVQTPRGIFF